MNWIENNRDDIEACLVMACFVVICIFIAMVGVVFGDYLWSVFGKITVGSAATMWMAHITSFTITMGVTYSVYDRVVMKRWWWK